MNLRTIPWSTAAVIIVTLIAVAVLAALEIDPRDLVDLAVLLLLGLGAGQLTAVREQSNGRISELIAAVREQGRMLANMQPPPGGFTEPGSTSADRPQTTSPE